MKYILAISDNNCIALGGNLPWYIKHDFQWFKMNTYGNPVIMGRKTWESLRKKPLPGRRNIVISRHKVPGVETVNCILKIRDFVKENPDTWVIGGAELCQQLWQKDDVILITRVHTNVNNGLKIILPEMKCIWSKKFDGYTFSINKITSINIK